MLFNKVTYLAAEKQNTFLPVGWDKTRAKSKYGIYMQVGRQIH